MGTPILKFSDRMSNALVGLNSRAKLAILLFIDGLTIPLCYYIGLAVNFDDSIDTLNVTPESILLVMAISILALGTSGIYRAVTRYIDPALLARAGGALTLACIAIFTVFHFLPKYASQRTALPLYGLLLFSYLLISRLCMRSLLRRHTGMQPRCENTVAIYGASETGIKLAMALRDSPRYRAVCFIDQKHQYAGRTLAGLRVFEAANISIAVMQFSITTVILALPDTSSRRLREVMYLVRNAKLEIKTLTRLFELDGNNAARSIRDIRIEDLLGREQVPPDPHLIAKCVTRKNVLVTGAGGSIGGELCRQVMAYAPKSLHLFDHSEYALYKIQQELAERFPNAPIETHLGSVCDDKLVDQILRDGCIDTLYHTAAYKHVPIVESNVAQGLRNNVVGARVIATAADKWKVSTCVLVSTDKAVRPTNIMGASKRIAELIFQAAAARSSHTVYSMVRFGNVLGSSGSVVPLFRRQIEAGGPLTVTHPEMTRYFMLIPEAAQLVVQAGAMAEGGEVFVLDMGGPVKIIDLARTMIAMAGLSERSEQNPDGDIAIDVVGMRPGEKLYEELLIGECARPSKHPRIMYANEYSLEAGLLFRQVDRLIAACSESSPHRILATVKAIVAEYSPSAPTEADGTFPALRIPDFTVTRSGWA